MRFKNFINSFNKRNRIYSEDDILKMQLASIFDNEDDILAQNREIGIPTTTELQKSQNTKWIEPFVDANGINDGGYWQSVTDDDSTPQYQDKQELPYTLKGAVQHNVVEPIQNSIDTAQNAYSKYKGLSPIAAIQKAAAKNLPDLHSSAKEYYEHALKLADGEEPTDFMKEQNDFYKLDEITDPELKQIYLEKAAKMYGLDVNVPATYDAIKNTNIVMPKENSQLHSQIKNSEDFQRWVAENYENIKNNTNKNASIEFTPDLRNYNKLDLFATIHNSDLKNSKINEDGSLLTIFSDAYDFDKISEKPKNLQNRLLQIINNSAFEQQEAKQLQKYLLSAPINLTKEELEEILRKYKRIH